ncbi:MAG: hypothetical protein RMM28_11055 [Thermoleophilia bacterium]|nr:hypothetical protein [Gaiellaceae bacterium]MDW8339664.1 hypothetical protein [Thermoleophilia bacterium]
MIEATSEVSKLEVRLRGPAAEGGRVRVDVLVEVAQAVQLSVTRLAYALRGEPTVRRGRTPREIADLTRLEVVGLHEGSTVLELELAGHERPLDELDLGGEAVRVFEAGLRAIASGEAPPQPWDSGVRQAVDRVLHVLDRGIDEIVVARPGAPPDEWAVFTRSTREERRVAVPPGARERVEIEGRLLMADFAAAREEARIHRPLDSPVRCTFRPELEGAVLNLLKRYVRAVGWAELDEQGQIKTLELESLEDAELTSGRTFWELPTLDELAEEQGIEPVERLEDLADGTWPEDESVDDFLAAIESRD